MVPPGVCEAQFSEGMKTHVWNEQYGALYDRTYLVLYDAGLNEKLADQLATQRTLASALNSCAAFASAARTDCDIAAVNIIERSY